MNARERFLRVMFYQEVDCLPVLAVEPYETALVDRWVREGHLPDPSPEKTLGMDQILQVPINFGPIPPFDQRILHENAETYIQITDLGATVIRKKEAPLTYYGHIDHPVKTLADWKQYSLRFDPYSSGRWVSTGGKGETFAALNNLEHPVGISIFPFFFRLGFYTLGMERFLTAFHDEPGLIHEMFSFWSHFILETVRPVLEHVKVDVIFFGEDLAYKNNTLISPRVYREFWHPYQDPIIRLIQEHEVPLICQWSSGKLDALLPDMLDHGINCTWPLDCSAGIDAQQLRARYGRNLRLVGNIPVKALLTGPRAIDMEIARLMPLIREGGFIPALDDMVPMETPFEHYRYLIDSIRDIRLD
jgi:hypothetical protein